MFYTLFLGALCMAVGLLQFLRPDLWWNLTERWKSYRADEPSDFYRKCTRLGGGVFFCVGLAGAVLPLILE